jgi:hypothetical protein
MLINPIDQRIRELCEKLPRADGEEVDIILAELRAALHEHMEFVRLMLHKSIQYPENDSDSKAAD